MNPNMICCLCLDPIEVGDVVAVIHQGTVCPSISGHPKIVPTAMEDGSFKKVTHLVCPVKQGAPLALIGAARDGF